MMKQSNDSKINIRFDVLTMMRIQIRSWEISQ